MRILEEALFLQGTGMSSWVVVEMAWILLVKEDSFLEVVGRTVSWVSSWVQGVARKLIEL